MRSIKDMTNDELRSLVDACYHELIRRKAVTDKACEKFVADIKAKRGLTVDRMID